MNRLLEIEEFVRGEEIEFLKSNEEETFVRRANYVYPTNSQYIRDLIAFAHKTAFGRFPKRSQVNEYIYGLEVLARNQGQECQLFLRVAQTEENFWYDLGGSTVKIGPNGWEIVENAPVYFKRYGNAAPQVAPQSGNSSLVDVLNFVNLTSNEDQLLFLAYLVSCFIPNIAHPIPVFFGEKGGAKSTAMRILRRLVDPSNKELMVLPKNQNDLAQVLAHHYMPAFDNMNKLTSTLSDVLCGAVTGGSIAKRKLYTDDEDVVIAFKDCVVLNGIDLMVTRSDLLDRSLLFEVTRIDEEHRRVEEEFWNSFQSQRPFLLGAIFDILSGAMGIINAGVTIDALPRMAGFALWGYAIAEAAGFGGVTFLDAYRNNIARVNDYVIEAEPIAEAIVHFMEQQNEWSGYATQLLEALSSQNSGYTLPTRTNLLSQKIRELASNLRVKGIECSFERETTQNKTIIQLRNSAAIPANEGQEITEAWDDGDEILEGV